MNFSVLRELIEGKIKTERSDMKQKELELMCPSKTVLPSFQILRKFGRTCLQPRCKVLI